MTKDIIIGDIKKNVLYSQHKEKIDKLIKNIEDKKIIVLNENDFSLDLSSLNDEILLLNNINNNITDFNRNINEISNNVDISNNWFDLSDEWISLNQNLKLINDDLNDLSNDFDANNNLSEINIFNDLSKIRNKYLDLSNLYDNLSYNLSNNDYQDISGNLNELLKERNDLSNDINQFDELNSDLLDKLTNIFDNEYNKLVKLLNELILLYPLTEDELTMKESIDIININGDKINVDLVKNNVSLNTSNSGVNNIVMGTLNTFYNEETKNNINELIIQNNNNDEVSLDEIKLLRNRLSNSLNTSTVNTDVTIKLDIKEGEKISVKISTDDSIEVKKDNSMTVINGKHKFLDTDDEYKFRSGGTEYSYNKNDIISLNEQKVIIGSLIFTGEEICFTDTCDILTKDGYRNIKDINVGDKVMTASGIEMKVIKKYVNKVKTNNYKPCLIEKNKYGINIPSKDTYITSGHAYYVNGKWTHPFRENLKYKWNSDDEYITYYNIKLENFKDGDIICNGMIMESWDGLKSSIERQYRWMEYNDDYSRVYIE